MLAGLSPARRRLVGVVTTLALVAVLVAVVLVARHRAATQVDPVDQAERGPVVLVPGFFGSPKALEPLRDALTADGRDVTVLELVGDGTGDLRVQARELGSVVDETLRRTGSTSVDVVAYSAGGVVARIWVREEGGAGLARRVVTIGSPHHGADIAGLAGSVLPGGCPLGCQQLAPDSDLLRQLNAGDETPDGPRFVSIWSESDDVVTPPDSAQIDGALDVTVQSVCSGSVDNHHDLPRDPLVIGFVEVALGVPFPDAPTQADCDRLSS